MDTTFRGWSSTLAARVRLVISRLDLIFALSLDFHGRVRVVRSLYLPAALHGIEASLLASDSLRKLQSSIHRVVWSRRQPLASVGAVLSLLDGRAGCGGFVCFVGIFPLWPAEVRRVYCLLEMVEMGALGMVLFIFFQLVLLRFVFGGILMLWLGPDLVYLCSVIWLALCIISRQLFLMLGVIRLPLTVAGLCWMSMAPCSSFLFSC